MASPSKTALILVDVYNDFLHPDGLMHKKVEKNLELHNTVKNMESAIAAARNAGILVIYGLHQPYQAGHYEGWNHMNALNAGVIGGHVFAAGQFGGTVYESLSSKSGDLIVNKHWNHSAFHNTDLDLQLRQRDITALVFAGMEAQTCLEGSARASFELGYDITMLSDASAGFSVEAQKIAKETTWPMFANRVVPTETWIKSLEG